jgi:hypothetical protein
MIFICTRPPTGALPLPSALLRPGLVDIIFRELVLLRLIFWQGIPTWMFFHFQVRVFFPVVVIIFDDVLMDLNVAWIAYLWGTAHGLPHVSALSHILC